ncbi:MAG TPA: hypothetical protein VF777_08165 [Phycisphaerales bacterium]
MGQAQHSRSHTGRKPNRVTARELVSACTLVLALGMLIWLKLRLVANVPRTAYAQPTQQLDHQPAATQGHRQPASHRLEPALAQPNQD